MVCKGVLFVHFFMCLEQALTYGSIYGPLYGEQWMLMTGDDGHTYYMDFTEPNDTEIRFLIGDAYFYLYTRNNRDEPEEIKFTQDKPIDSINFNATNDIKAITHGWLSSGSAIWVIDMTKAFLRSYDANVIVVDWSDMSKNPIYPWSALATKYVGRKVAEMMDGLQDNYGVGGDRVHLLGHSLGAQVMGYAGSYSAQNISRITGLDPARPLFEIPNMGDSRRLDRSDADFVDIIHTCGGMLGYRYSHGHADFYPNGGTACQPGCEGIQNMKEACSHGRSYEYYTESIESKGFVSYRCSSQEDFKEGRCADDTNFLGEFADTSLWGDFYLETNSKSKYAKDNE